MNGFMDPEPGLQQEYQSQLREIRTRHEPMKSWRDRRRFKRDVRRLRRGTFGVRSVLAHWIGRG